MRKLEALWFRYFSGETLNSEDSWVRYLVAWIMSVPAIIAVGMNAILGGTAGLVWILIYSGVLVVFGVLWIVIYIYHNWRITKEKTNN